jgi:hypothetical protein
MSAKHTPGLWWVTDKGIRDSGGYICHTNSVQRYEGQDERYAREVAQREADKRLIAAAPELLDQLQIACQRIADMLLDDDGQAFKEARKALPRIIATIAKATN